MVAQENDAEAARAAAREGQRATAREREDDARDEDASARANASGSRPRGAPKVKKRRSSVDSTPRAHVSGSLSAGHTDDEDHENVDEENDDGDDDDDEDEEDDERPRLPPMKAPPLLPSQIERLSDPEARLILGRWNARLRGLKRRANDLAHQFPTSNVLVMFSKPFQTKRRRGKWAEEEFVMLGPMARAVRSGEDFEHMFASNGASLSGAQIIRRAVADLSGLSMSGRDKSLDAPPASVAEQTSSGYDATKATLDELFGELSRLVAPINHSELAHVLVNSGILKRAGGVAGKKVMEESSKFRDQKKASQEAAMARLASLLAKETGS